MMRDRLGQPLDALVEKLRQEFPQLISVYRFGSYGTERERPAGDLDLAVYAGKPLPAAKLWYVAQELASTVMRARVIHDGERIYRADRFACETFEDYVYSSYARLNDAVAGCKTRRRDGLWGMT